MSEPSTNFWKTRGWAELPFFLAVARLGSLRAAAQDLGVNHATVNRNISDLEHYYGAKLFYRRQKGLTLTPVGKDLFCQAEAAEEAVFRARRVARHQDTKLEGPVRVTMGAHNAYYFLAPLLEDFQNLYPDIDLRITVENTVQNLAEGPADVSVRSAWNVDDNVTGKKIGVYHAAIMASPDYLERNWPARGEKGEGLHWIGNGRLWPVPEIENQRLFPNAKRVFDTSDPIMKVDLVRRGYGMSIMPLSTLLLVDGLTVVPDTPIVPERNVWVLVQTELKNTARVRAVMDFLSKHMGQLVDAETAAKKRILNSTAPS